MDLVGIVYNNCFGGFSLSREAILLGRKISGNPMWGGPNIKGDVYENGEPVPTDYGYINDIPRHDPILVEVVRTLMELASGSSADLQIRDVPRGTRYYIHEYDGSESVIIDTEHHWEVAE